MNKNKLYSFILENVTCRIRGAMVARLTPDQKVACSIHVGFTFMKYFFFFFFFILYFSLFSLFFLLLFIKL